jgi:hypothetical protein
MPTVMQQATDDVLGSLGTPAARPAATHSVVPPGSGSAPQPVVMGSGPQPSFDPAVDPASVMSPVGENYPAVDWAEAAAVRVRVVPPWMLALLFVGALVGALVVTILIAKIIR